LILKIYRYFKGMEVWDAKMSEPLRIRVSYVPEKDIDAEQK
jgi:hypothetical protein